VGVLGALIRSRASVPELTLKRSPEMSHTQGLIDISEAIMEKHGVAVEVLRPVDRAIAYGVYPDMTDHGWERDEWPEVLEKVMASDILVLGSPIWLGEKSSVCTKVIERLYSASGELNEEYVIPPQADAGWVGEAGPGPSYLDPGSGGPENDFTNRNTGQAFSCSPAASVSWKTPMSCVRYSKRRLLLP